MKNIDPGTATKRKKSMAKTWLIGAALLMSVALPLFGQSQNNLPDLQSLSSLFSLTQQNQTPQTLAPGDLVQAVDENRYHVDSGDEFYIRVDVQGPDVKIFNLVVSSDGMLVFPDVSALYLRGMLLKKAKRRIYKHLKDFYHDAEIDVSLSKVHKVRVSVIGALEPVVQLDLTSADHLVDAIQNIVVAYQADTSRVKFLDHVSARRIDIIRNKVRQRYDLLKFMRLGDLSQNPLLRSNDVIFVHYRDSLKSNLVVGGEVGQPGVYEFVPGDDLALAVKLAGGMLPSADSNRIELYRQGSDGKFERRMVRLPADSALSLQAGDQVFVRAKPKNREQKFVEVEGEVKYPGTYPIEEGQTRLSQVVQWCGGFTEDAAPELAFVQRMVKKDKRLEQGLEAMRMMNVQNKVMPTVDVSFIKDYYRQNLQILQADFSKIAQGANPDLDFLLQNGDRIVVPARVMAITVAGAVRNPGIYPYVKGATLKDYVKMAGGYAPRAKKGLTKIIKYKSGAWLDAGGKSIPQPGDKIFIPQRSEIEFWPMLKEVVTMVAQLGTIFVIIRSVNK